MKKHKMLKILVFGNPLLKYDSLPIRILPALRKEFPEIEFRVMDGIEDIQKEGRNLIIMDSVEGLKKAGIITSIKSLKPGNKCSVHDFDISQNLKLLKKIGEIDKAVIIGIPMGISESEAFSQARKLIISTLLSGNARRS